MSMIRRATFAAALLFAFSPALVAPLAAQRASRITSPKEEFGFEIGDDYMLANYQQISTYWRKLARESDRIVVQEIGKTAEGRPHLMAIVTSPENHKKLARLKEISARLARAEGLTDAQARALAKEGKAVVWIDGGLHATETVGAQQLAQIVYEMVSRNDEETLRILNDVVILFVHANPDGNDLVANWYMRNPDPKQRSLAQLPKLYQKYIGHDNNRDFFMSTQPESENMNRVLYHEWFPQILYNHHQSGPAGTVVYSPPLRDPYNYNLDPMIILGLQSLGAAMHTRLAAENKGGATMDGGGPYDGWWNGGIRNTATFHNIIAMLTEIIGSPTPMRIPLVLARQIPSGDIALPIAPQEWRMKQSIEYSLSLDRAVLDYASRMRENLLYNIYTMGKHSIERGSRDTWTANPRRDGAIAARLGDAPDSVKWAAMKAPELRDPRGYIIPSNQADFPTATKFVNALRETGITVLRATRGFTVNGKQYPAGSYVVKTAQAFRPHIMDMFEPQVHPDVIPYPGANPTPPYDNAGWTLAFQMGIEFDRILDGFDGPFEKITDWNTKPPAGRVIATSGTTAGYLLANRPNDSFTALNRLLASGEDVVRLTQPLPFSERPDPQTFVDGTLPAGALYVRAKATTAANLQKLATPLGLDVIATPQPAPASAVPMRMPRIGLWDTYGGSMPSGWTRWILEQFDFPFERVFAPQLDAGDLNAKYDVLIFVNGAIPGAGGGRGGGRGGRGGRGGGGPEQPPPYMPDEYRSQFGRMTLETTMPKLREFIEKGGTVIAIGSSATNLASYLELPIENHLVENGSPLPRTKFYSPGSLISARVDTSHPVAQGMAERVDVFFDDSPVFKLAPKAAEQGVKAIAWFDGKTPLRSGWAWGQHYLENGVVAAEAKVGAGRALLFGPEILQRAQPHGTFKFLFNGIYTSIMNGTTRPTP